ncbi:unnamed protein product [Clavelina lepadiformis]|uniref:Uncharacterized protein n=1 Tax=Clavelina lepadiformis TaxID=159417 RepID=A0ABP0F194_CLALP
MSGYSVVDPDHTSPSHIHRALQRAAASFYSEKINEPKPENPTISKTAVQADHRSIKEVGTSRASYRSYTSASSPITFLTAKEIQSSVKRSRRWSGARKSSTIQSLKISPHHAGRSPTSGVAKQSTVNQNEETAAPESAYHRTIYDILSAKSPRSSYGHLTKALERSEKNPIKRQNPSLERETLEKILLRDGSDGISSQDKNNPYYPAKYDWALRYSLKPNQDIKQNVTTSSNVESLPRIRNIDGNNCAINPVNLTNVLNDLERRKSPELVPSVKRQAAHRALQAYLKREQSATKAQPKYFMTIRLPNPSASYAENEIAKKRKTRLSMRRGNQASVSSFLPFLERCESHKGNNSIASNLPASPPNSGLLCRTNVQPFVFSKHSTPRTAET